ncbi:PREDICTED: JNK-interacting protein 3 isoform X1 [Ceratosolen solmsi marchali]|uniref:JNK-interacting protein 3 n=1 Tax=Ceratosolen solmsi marchali TaxID=326594 RepID=A0AAJ6YDV3_9HYME|nr:PREDICTED: JNK-interacting protein 3 isoform X1 [Ceratosolen solmsi marchali]
MTDIKMDQETVYGTHEDSHVVMSEKVQSLAGSIYQEFERMIARYDEDVVKELMPLLVNVLECLDIAYTQNQEHEVELELLREDNEQLVTQYEREKQLRKTSDQKLLELEDTAEDERKDLVSKIDSLESIVRMLELKTKNSHDHGTNTTDISSQRKIPHIIRLEEKESELKREYSRLHDRYTELFKTHVDYMERTKMLVGSTERLENSTVNSRGPSRLPALGMTHMSRSSGPLSYGFQSLEASTNALDIQEECPSSGESLRTEMLDNSSNANVEMFDKSQLTDQPVQESKTTAISRRVSPETEIAPTITTPTTPRIEKLATTPGGRSRTDREERRSANTLYQEISFQDADALGEMDEGADITGSYVHPGEYASSVNDNFFGMGKEVENLIMENNELLATKNALNIVKDDLIIKVDELSGELDLLNEQIRGLQQARDRLRHRVLALEEELKKVKEEADAAAKATKSDDEEEVPLAQRKRFTRAEMARVLMERNQYKERFMELQEAVRWTEMIRASKTDPSSISGGKQTFWKFFSSLFTGPADRGPLIRGPHIRYSAPANQIVPAAPLDMMRRRALKNRHDFLDQGDTISSEKLVARRANERREQYRQVRAHVRKEDGRLQAYGWSLPGKPIAPTRQPVPVPVYCRPIQETESGMRIWCGAGVNLSGGKTRDGGSMVGGSVFYAAEARETSSDSKIDPEDAVEHLDKELQESEKRRLDAERLEQQLSSLVWICTSTQKMSKVTVIDANNPADILQVFNVCQSHLLCIASVPGAKENDYVQILKDNDDKEQTNKDVDNQAEIALSDEGQEDSKIVEITKLTISLEEQLDKLRKISVDSNSATELASIEVDAETANLGKVRFVKNVFEFDSLHINTKDNEEKLDKVSDTLIEKMSSIQPTMWLGAQDGAVFVHSAVANWSVCLHTVKLQDAALAIVHIQGRVLVALADGTVAVFRRGVDGQWDLSQYHVITLGSPQHSIRCMAVVLGKTVWCGYRNKIHVIDPISLSLEVIYYYNNKDYILH